ncbi:MAG: cation-translocating P-type ATPase [Patescibacteria group bacterium]
MKGLTSSQAAQLQKEHGLNVIEGKQKKPFIAVLFDQFNNFLTVLLILAAVASFFIGEAVDGALILAIVILNALFGIYQEAKAEESIAALKKITVTKIRVIRDGIQQEIESQYLVPGDICFIEEGVKIPADGKIRESMNLELNEAVLTGESLPVSKKAGDEIFSGTIVAKGRGFFEVEAIAMKTKFGKIAQNLSAIDDGETPLQKKLKGLTRLIGIVGICAAAAVFVISLIQGTGYFPAFLLAISLAVAVVPEGLPAVMTITLSIGVKEMSRRKSIVRKLSAIEALGSVTLIATDKTGTLTTNKMKVAELYVSDELYEGSHLPQLENKPFFLLVQNGILCSTASLVRVHDHGKWDVLGDPTEGALLYLAHESGVEYEDMRKEWKIIYEKPFDSVVKRMSVVVTDNDKTMVFSKGAPESILEISDSIQKGNEIKKLTAEEKKRIEEQMEKWAKKGLRVLAFSYVPFTHKPTTIDLPAGGQGQQLITNNQIFLGMVAIHDAPRPEVIEAVKRAKQAGIQVVMITGDNEKTAEAIGVVSGIVEEGAEILTGQQLEQYSDEDLMKVLPRVRIFARTSPFHKHRIVKLYQKLGEVVAVTGDGVNDSIALKQADVGVAMGLVGTDVAREAADMIITDDNFASIVNAVDEGRNIIKNLKNAIQYLLSCNVTEAISLIGGMLFGFSHIFYPIQLLYINLVTDGIPALSLAFSPRNPGLMKEKPDTTLTLLKAYERKYILLVGLMGTVLILTGFYLFLRVVSEASAYTAAFSILTLIQSFILVDLWLSHQSLHKNTRSLLSPIFLFSFGFPFAAQLLIVMTPQIAQWFKVTTVSFPTYLVFIFISSLSFIGIKLLKRMVKIV